MENEHFEKLYINIDDDEATMSYMVNPEAEGELREYAIVTREFLEGLLHRIGFRAVN